MKTTFITFIVALFAFSFNPAFGQNANTSQTQFIEKNERKIAYRSIGKGTPIVLVNRFRGTLDTWDPLFLDKLAENHKVITFDYTGIGNSTGKLPTDISLVAQDVKDLSEALKLNKITVLGWSYGGLVAQAATILYPDLVTHAVLVGTNPPGKNDIPLEQAFLDVALKPINNANDEIILFFEPKSPASVVASKLSHDRIAKRLDVSKIPSSPEILNLYSQGVKRFVEDKENFRAKLQEIKTPLLIISGDHDISFAVENWFQLHRKLQNAQFITFTLTGHGPQHQFPELTANNIKDFIQFSKK